MLIMSCAKKQLNVGFYSYNTVLFSVQDFSGNDLVKGIEYDWWQSDEVPDEETALGGAVNFDLYNLDFVFPDISMDPFTLHKEFINGTTDILAASTLLLRKINGYSYLGVQPISNAYNNDGIVSYHPAERLTFKLNCPYVFGDNAEHEIVSYWKARSQSFYNDCYRVEFDGKEYTFDEYSERQDGGKTGVIFTVVLETIKHSICLSQLGLLD